MVLLYAAAAALWVFGSDAVFWRAGIPAEWQMPVSIAKGILFVLVTSFVLAVVLTRREHTLALSRERLEASEARFRRTFENSGVGMVHLDAAGVVADANPPAEALLGAAAGRRLSEFAVEPYRQQIEDALAALESTVHLDIEITTGAKGIVPVRLALSPLRAASDPASIIAVLEDMQAARAAEQERLRVEHERNAGARTAQEIINSIPVTVFELGSSAAGDGYELTWISDYVAAMTGFPLSDWTSNRRLWIELVPDDQREEVVAGVRAAATAESPSRVVFDWRTKSGRPLRVTLYISPIPSDTPGSARLRCVAIDSTAEMEARQAVENSELLFRRIMDSTSDVVTIFDVDGTILYQSPSIERVLGWQHSELNGQNFIERVHPDDRASTLSAFNRVANGSTERTRTELRFEDRRGGWRTFESEAYGVGSGSSVELVVSSSRDVTERRILQSQLERSRRVGSLGRLATTVAHEFNNLLMSIQPSAELLRRNISDPDLERPLERIIKAVTRGKTITSEILRFTRPIELNTTTLNFCDLLVDFCNELKPMLPSTIQLRLSAPPEPLWIRCDPSQITQALSNLAANASDAMAEGGSLEISLRPVSSDENFAFGVVPDAERYALLTVSDSGQGLSRDAQQHIFEPLFTTKSQGTGLGLVVTDQIVRAHEGLIFFESAPARGTSFHLFLPISEPATEGRTAQTALSRNDLAGLKVLVVEDETAVAEGLTALMELEGIAVRLATTAAAALDSLHKEIPDVVVLDLGLPDRDGLEVYAEIAASHPELPVIFSSGHGDASRLSAFTQRPNVRFLQKPYEVNMLLDAIGTLTASSSTS